MRLNSLVPGTVRRLIADVQGASAVEFSLIAPFLVLGAFSTVDAGMAVYDKMMITQAMRAGAQSAIAAEDAATVQAVVETTASENFTVASGAANPGELSVSVGSYCACADDLSTTVNCLNVCPSGGSPHQFYDLAATLEFDGVILPNFTLSGEMTVLAQ